MKKETQEQDIKAIAGFFAVWWSALVLEPSRNRSVRAVMADLGLVRHKGPLALTARGERALKIATR